MDSLSVTAGVITIPQLTTKVLSLLTNPKGASTDRERCTLELSNLSTLLIHLRFRLQGGGYDEPWYRSINALSASNGPLDRYKQALEELQGSMTNESGITKLGQTIMWKLKKEEIESILLRIERLKTLVQIVLELDHLKLSQALKTGIHTVQNDTQAVKQNTDAFWSVEEKRQVDSLTEWISTPNYPAQQSDIISARQEDTGVPVQGYSKKSNPELRLRLWD
ncbi:hypothetical protein EJ05DRAFT_490767 [Pseudovirgaria hyperparasitica]|uniref:Uncharacterized protein n=1 Tax=Pseudovirgaria hyperparasitica TaxID=470096 RepID=A0A6A6VSR4_9PEZI|nr:uncharacterized protein EJ05DRAFT_490767 [Pseudovirgaria hyperparasitica]KAF2752630.1 hypothetical protein EJ05DRAFT_490767 [Pseudovirgaria hyperparasitica]